MVIELSAITAAVGAVWRTIEDPAKDLAKGLAKKVVDERIGDAVKRFKRRLVTQLPLPPNHDLVRGLREDYLTAMQKILNYYKVELRGIPAHEHARLSDDLAFVEVVQDWLNKRIHPIRGSGVDYQNVTEADVEGVLDHMVHPSVLEGFARRAETARTDAERRVLAEIGEVWRAELPPRFLSWFRGGDDKPGWYLLFALYVNERIKTDERFRSIFVAAELVDIKRLIEEADRRITDVKTGVDRIEQNLRHVVEKLNAAEDAAERRHCELIAEFARERGVPLPALQAQLARLGEVNVPIEQIPARLEIFVTEFLRADSGSLDSGVRSYLGQASEHDTDHGEADEGHDGAGISLEVASEPAIARDPCEGALDDPSLG
jgi:hypothetical protein